MADQTPSDSSAPPSMPPVKNDGATSPKNVSINDPVRRVVKQLVSMTNCALATFEEATDETSTMLVSRLRQLGKQGTYIATRVLATYEQRGQYAVPIVAGSAAVVGGLVAMRTGKIPGALAAGVAGAAAYGNIYGYEDYSATSWRNSVPRK
ncbi:hypothetical protein ACHAXA_003475 [Cyclostephanos tholiformis]|uniref:Uncharacterized protein n=1 Tax=Cyclostephanos tholiformis TaxID=382380 RepID=A0ABD3SFK8_9STRA